MVITRRKFKSRNSTTISPDVLMPEADTSAPPPPPISFYIRRGCNTGQLVEQSQLPNSCEDTTATGIARRLVQTLLSASPKPDLVLARLATIRGDELAVSHDGTTYTIKLPSIQKSSDLNTVFVEVTHAIGSCSNLFSLIPVNECCSRCSAPQLTAATTSSTSPPPTKRKAPAELEAATSTTPADPAPLMQESPGSACASVAKTPTNEWTIEDVIQFIEATDPALAVHAELFRKHEIDGKALLLLNSDMMMKYMGLKLGPALKICNLVTRLKGRRHMLH